MELEGNKRKRTEEEQDDAVNHLYIRTILHSLITIVDTVVASESTMKCVEVLLKLVLNTNKMLPKTVKEKINKIIMNMYDKFCLRTTLDPPDALEKIVKGQGDYKFEIHTIITSDGMPLQLHRLQKNGHWNQNSMPIFLQHGMLSSSADFLLKGGLAYQLADDGRDVWLGNFRGSIFSRRELREEINDELFWGHDVDDHGAKDLPEMLDFVLKTTEEDQVIYVGHSMGATALFIMCDLMPEYNSKIKDAYLLAPVAELTNITGLPKNVVRSADLFVKILEMFKIYTLFFPRLIPGWSVMGVLLFQICGYNAIYQDIDFDINHVENILKFSPSGATTKNFIQYIKCHDAKKLISNDDNPHVYSLANTKIPVTILYGQDDAFAGTDNIKKMKTDLPNVKGLYKMPDNFGHLDFLWEGKPATEILHNLINQEQEPIVHDTDEDKIYSKAPESSSIGFWLNVFQFCIIMCFLFCQFLKTYFKVK